MAPVMDPRAPTTVYTGAAGGLFRSKDGAKTWHAAGAGLTVLSVNTLLRLAACSPCQYNIGGQSRSRIHFQP